MSGNSQRVWCSLCNATTTKQHELQHRRHSNIPPPSIYTLSTPTIIDLSSDTESECSDSTVSAPRSLFPDLEDTTSCNPNHNMFQDDDSTSSNPEQIFAKSWGISRLNQAVQELANIQIPHASCIPDWLAVYPRAEVYDSDNDYPARPVSTPVIDPSSHRPDLEGGEESSDEDISPEYWGDGVEFDSEDSESDEDDGELGFGWEALEKAKKGVSAFKRLGEKFQVEVASLASRLSDLDHAICRAYAWKLRAHVPDETYRSAPDAFGPREGGPLPNLRAQQKRLFSLSGFTPHEYHCCVKSCICFAGPHANLSHCPYCNEPRLNASGKPRKIFTYIPLIPRLIALYGHRYTANLMLYRHHRDGKKTASKVNEDIFDGANYKALLNERVRVGDTIYSHHYFSDPREVALGLSTDGFAPFKKRSKTAWPIILINYNLPPDVRCHLEHLLALGVIPGPTKPHDWDSFIWPLMEEMSILATEEGITTLDILRSCLFPLRAHIITGFGDIPAMSMVMKMKGHNGKCPCRLCLIQALRTPGGKTHYVPLNRSSHPDVVADSTKVKCYDPMKLPLRTPSQFLSQATEVEAQPNKTAAERLAKSYGIKGIPMLSRLGSLKFPTSLPYDFMHEDFENLLPNLVLHWTGQFKGLDDSKEEYIFPQTVWEAIGRATAAAGDTIPSAYGGRVPNIEAKKSEMNAERWSFWALYIAPVVLQQRFIKASYYRHFIELVRLINMCLQFKITPREIDDLEKGFARWVTEYERIYYQIDPDRLPTCPLTIHALLHIAQSIRDMGPVWCYWAFVMERYCGTLTPDIRSRRFPFRALDRSVVERAQITQIGLKYGISKDLRFHRPPAAPIRGSFECNEYPGSRLLPPFVKERPPANLIQFGLAASFATRFNIKITQVRTALKHAAMVQYGGLKQIDSEEGDTMRCFTLFKPQQDSRDPTFVRYEMYVDRHERNHKAKPEYKLQTFYGRLEHLFVVRFQDPQSAATRKLLGVNKTTENVQQVYILAAMRRCLLETGTTELESLDIHMYSKTGPLDVLDVTAVQCLVGRVPNTHGGWAIIDRSGALVRAVPEGTSSGEITDDGDGDE